MCTPKHNASLGHRVHNPNGISIGSAIFAHLTAERRRACPGASFPLKIAPSHGAIWTPSNTRFLAFLSVFQTEICTAIFHVTILVAILIFWKVPGNLNYQFLLTQEHVYA